MNIQEYDIMNEIAESGYENQRILTEKTGYSLGKVNQSLNELIQKEYLTKEYQLTEKAEAEFEKKAPKNAIILAAGYGIRMMPMNREVPKGLIEVNGEPLIERLIRQLHEAGIFQIDIIVGFMKEQYEYLIDEFQVNLIVNREYAQYNNLHSLALAKDRISNTYIIPCDVWCEKNPFSKRELYSWYMVTDLVDDESDVRVNRKLELVSVDAEKSGNAMVGIAYILEEEAGELQSQIKEMSKKKAYANVFWESALMKKGKMYVSAKIVPSRSVYEINTYEQLRELDDTSKQLDSDVIHLISEILACEPNELEEIEVLKKGMTNRSFMFKCRGKRFIMRIPGEGTEMLINRKQEYEVYQVIKPLGICDSIRYINPENGYKITEFLEGARVCDPLNYEDVKKCMKRLHAFHDLKLKVNHEFDFFGQMEFYETLWEGMPSVYKDYEKTKAILDSNPDVTAMKNLRNYSVHYQPLFSRFEIWSKNNNIVFSVNSNNRASDQYQKFVELAHRVIKKELLAIHYFDGMCFDQKMVPKDRKNERVSIFRCDNCNSELMVTDYFKDFLKEKCKLKILCERCKQYSTITDTGKSQIVHPEKYDSLLVNELNNMDVIDSNGRSIFQDINDSNT